MKTRIITIIVLLIILAALITHSKNNKIASNLMDALIPIKHSYQNILDSIEEAREIYIDQKDHIEELKDKNQELQKKLLEQKNYIEQAKTLRAVFPSLKKLPKREGVDLVQTISYVKFNNFSQVVLTKPKNISNDRIYGLIQDNVVGGVARIENNQLRGYLTSDEKCRYSVYVGKLMAPGVAIGGGNRLTTIQFIPKWFDIKEDDKVFTSGLDGIFFANIPVGVVRKVELQGSYKVAYVNTYNDVYHPKTFFMITHAKPTMFNANKINYAQIPMETPAQTTPQPMGDFNATLPTVTPSTLSSTPLVEMDQTREDTINPEPRDTQIDPARSKTRKQNSSLQNMQQGSTSNTQKPAAEENQQSTLDAF